MNKILVVGESSLNIDVYTYAKSFFDIFQKLEFEVTFFNNKKNYLLSKGTIYQLNSKLHFFNNYLCNKALKNFVIKYRPDLVFFIKSENIYPATLTFIKQYTNAILVNFYPDNPFVFWNSNSNANLLKSLPIYDHFLIWSKDLIPVLKSAGCKNVDYFPFAYDSNLFVKDINISLEDEKLYKSDVCFIGTWEPDRELWLEALCKNMPDISLSIWGNMWKEHLSKNSVLFNKIKGPAIYKEKMIKAFRFSKVVLNFIRQQNMFSHNMRTFEVPASNGFLLTERTKEQAVELFQEGISIECFSSLEELCSKIKFYLIFEHERKRIIENASERAKMYALDIWLKDFIDKISNNVNEKRKNSDFDVTSL